MISPRRLARSRRTAIRLAPLFALLALLAGCSSPPPEFFTLAAVPGPVLHGPHGSIELRRIGLAAYLDRPGIVRSNAAYRLQVTGTERWGEPLGSMLERIFTEDLVQRLPDALIFNDSGAISTKPGTIVEIDVQRFDPDADGTVVLLAQVAIRAEDEHSAAIAKTIRLTTQPAGPSTTDLAAALSTVLGQLADQVGGLLAGR
jgi:uncharacterized lipoprotein YmbA